MTVANRFTYVGSELQLFSAACNWKEYLYSQVAGYLGRDVLEVGAGFGGSTRTLARGCHDRWLCLEPDALLASQLQESIDQGRLPDYCQTLVGTISDVTPDERFDAILYMDVLEHIEDDLAEVHRAAARLVPGGRLIVVCPAHQWLYSPFDRAIGHFRRYNKRMFRALGKSNKSLDLLSLRYLDSVGLCASLANRLLLKQSMPTEQQIAVWDKTLVPLSRWVDILTCHGIGKSVLGVWRRRA